MRRCVPLLVPKLISLSLPTSHFQTACLPPFLAILIAHCSSSTSHTLAMVTSQYLVVQTLALILPVWMMMILR